jgi:hypothetical protein
LFWGQDTARDGLGAARAAIAALPDDGTGAVIAVALNAPPAPFVPPRYHFAPGHALILVGFGSAEDHAAALVPAREACPPLFEFVTPIPYVALQQMLDGTAPWGIRGYEKAIYLDDLTDDAIEVLAQRAGDKTSPMSFAPIFRLDGAYVRVADDATAYGGRRAPQYLVNIAACSTEPDALAADRMWVRSIWDALRPMATDGGGYINFMAEQDDDRVRVSYGPAKYERLARIKAEYDPGNVLHRNANIKPS